MIAPDRIRKDEENREVDRTIAGGGVVNLIGNVIGLLDPLFLWMITFFYGPENLGNYILSTTYVAILVNLGLMGFDKGLKRYIPIASAAREEAAEQIKSLGTALRYITLFTLLGAISVYALSDVLIAVDESGASADSSTWLKVLVWVAPFEALSLYCVHALRGASRMWPFVFVRNFLSPLVLLVVGVGGVLLGLGSWFLLVAYISSRTVAVAVAFVLLFRGFPVATLKKLLFSPRQTELIKFSFPLGISEFLIYFLVRVDVVMITFFYPESPQFVAFYGIASMFSGMIKKVRHGFDESFGPVLAGMIASRQMDVAQRSYHNVSRWLLLIMLFAAPPACFAAPFILSLFGEGFAQYWLVVPILMASRVIAAFIGPTQVVLVMAGKSKTELMNNIVGNVLNIAMNVVLIPTYGVYGAAFATTVSIVLLYIVRAMQIYKAIGITQDYKVAGKTMAAGAVSAIPGILIMVFTQHLVWTLVAAISYVIVYHLALKVIGVDVNLRKILEMIKSKPKVKEVSVVGSGPATERE